MKTICNSVQLSGRLGKDPEVRIFNGGKKKAQVSLATTERFRNSKGEWANDTQWHLLVAWDKQADFFEQNLKKGSEVSIQGRLVTRKYDDKTGARRYVTEVVVNEISLPGSTTSEPEETQHAKPGL